jgi:hypothetical protein
MAFRSGEAAMFRIQRILRELIFSLTVTILWTVNRSIKRAKGYPPMASLSF